MTVRIRDVYVVNHRLDPHETELRIHVDVEGLAPTTEIKGRLVGPRSVYSSTVEIAYPMREVSRDSERIELRVVIPEASWWEPKTPFLYQGPLELWQDGERRERIEISHGIRWLQLGAKGLRVNGRQFVLRGRIGIPELSEAELKHWHDEGVNTLLLSVAESDSWRETDREKFWATTDQCGVFVIHQNPRPSQFLRCNAELHSHASGFGWIAEEETLELSRLDTRVRHYREHGNLFYGTGLGAPPLPKLASFAICNEAESFLWTTVGLPKIVLTKRLLDPLPATPDVIGWIESAP